MSLRFRTGLGLLVVASSLGMTGWASLGSATHNEPVAIRPIEIIFGGSLEHTTTSVLLVPPTHGDLGNPLGRPSLEDYLDTTLSAIHRWEAALDEFAADYPQYLYLADISVTVQLFDGAQQASDYDVVIGYVETSGGVFRGVATDCLDNVMRANPEIRELAPHPRCIGLSLLANSGRAHQSIPDYPELSDLYTVTMHEFAHTWGLGHTLTRYGNGTYEFDLMNSPYPAVYGDGNPAGDGGERTPVLCISSLDLYGMARLYEWVPSGEWQPFPETFVSLPPEIPYELYC